MVVIGLGKNLLFKSVLAHCDHETILHEAGKINIKSAIAHLDIFGPNSKPRICEVRPPRGSVSRGLAVPVSLTYHKLVEMLVLTRFANHR